MSSAKSQPALTSDNLHSKQVTSTADEVFRDPGRLLHLQKSCDASTGHRPFSSKHDAQELQTSRRELQSRLDKQEAELQEQFQLKLQAAEELKQQQDSARSSAAGQLLQLQQACTAVPLASARHLIAWLAGHSVEQPAQPFLRECGPWLGSALALVLH